MAKQTDQATAKLKTKQKPKSLFGALFLILFALPFAGIGLYKGRECVREFWAYRQAQSWTETPATLLKAELKEVDGDDCTTYKATASYRYEFDGKTYVSDRVALRESSDNVGGFQRKLGKQLQQKLQNKEAVTAYVNPANPAEALLNRDFRPEMMVFDGMFALMFGGIGLGMMAGGLIVALKLGRETKRSRQFPDEPWKWKNRWAHGRIRSSNHAWWALIAATFWNGTAWPMTILMVWDDGTWPELMFMSIFLMIGIGLAIATGYLWLRRWKWGVSEFEMATVPGVLGGPLAGVVHVPRPIKTDSGIKIRLVCEQSVSDGDSKKTETLWEEERMITRDLTIGGVRTLIPVEFVTPYDLPDSNADDVTWKLTASAKTSGVNYEAEFEVPVFKTAASSSTPTSAAVEASDLFAPLALATIAADSSARLEEDFPDRKTLVFPMARHVGLAIFSTIFTLGWTSVCVWLLQSDAPWFVAWIFSAISAVVLPFLIAPVFESSRLEFSARGVTATRRIAGFGKEQRFSPEQIESVDAVKSGMAYGNTTYWNVELRDRQGKRHKLATAIPRRQLAERLAEEIAAAVGLSQSRSGSEASRMELESELPSELRRG